MENAGMVVLELGLRSLPILGGAWLLTVLMRRASASARHAVWTIAIGTLLVLPLLQLLPGWRVLPQWTIGMAEPVRTIPALAPAAPSQIETAPIRAEEASIAARAAASLPFSPALALWLAGAALVLSPTLLGWLRLRVIERNSRTPEDASWTAHLEAARRLLGIARGIRLLTGSGRSMPMTWGLWRPRILIPAEGDRWSHSRKRMVLLHELAHVARWDCLTLLLARAACAIYWFNPLVWVALRRMQIERERACDDIVLRVGTPAPLYARELLDLTAGASMRSPALPALAMAPAATLECRVREILDHRRNRRALSAGGFAATLLIMALLVIPAACVQSPEPAATTSRSAAADRDGPQPALWVDDTRHSSYDMMTLVHYAHVHAARHDGRLPPDIGSLVPLVRAHESGVLATLAEQQARPLPDAERARLFLSLPDEQQIARPGRLTREWVNQNATYTYIGNDQVAIDDLADEWGRIVLYHTPLDRPHIAQTPDGREMPVIALAFMDSHGEVHLVADARRMIERSVQQLAQARKPR